MVDGRWSMVERKGQAKESRVKRTFLILLAAILLLPHVASAQEPAPPPEEPAAEPPKVIPPKLEKFVHAEYPDAAFKEERMGSVAMLVVVDASGVVGEVTVTGSAGPEFDEAAVAAVKQFVFSPATLDGTPVPVRIGYTYHFKLEKKSVKVEEGQVIQGKVKEKGVGLPIVAAEIAILEARTRTTSNAKGRFTFRKITPGEYTAVITHAEFKTKKVKLKVEEGKTLEIQILIEPVLANPYEIVVVGKKEEAVVTKYVLEQRTLETVPGTFGDPVRVVETLPGVARAPFGVGMLVIRGSMPQSAKAYINGVEVPLMYHFLGGPSILNPNFMDQIEYYPGNFPVRYGGALSGMVNVPSKTDKVEQVAGEADINLINSSVFLEAPLSDKASIRVGARRSYVDLVILAAMRAYGETSTVVAPIFWDYQAELAYNLNSQNRLGLLFLGSQDILKLVTTADEEDKPDIDLSVKTNFHRAISSWRYAEEDFSFLVQPYLGWDNFSFGAVNANLDAHIFTAASRQELKWKLDDSFTLLAGLEGGAAYVDFLGEVPMPKNYYQPGSTITGDHQQQIGEPEKLEMSDIYWAMGSYAQMVIEPVGRLQITPGFRFALWHNPATTIPMWDPRLVIRQGLHDDFALKGGVGKFSQAPDPQFTDEEHGNPELDAPWSMHYSGGVEWRITDNIELDLIGFYVTSHDLVVQSSEVEVTEDGTRPVVAKNDGRGESYGMELMLRHRPTKRFYGWLAYTLSRSQLSSNAGKMDPDEDPTSAGDALELSPFDQTHILSLVGSVRLGRGWETGLRVRLVSGNPTTPINQGIFVGDSSMYQPISGAFQSDRLPTFFQMDLRVEKLWTYETWQLAAYVDIMNATNQANTEFISWDYRFNESWNVPGIPFFPSFGINGRF